MAGSREATQRAAGVSAHRPLIKQANGTYAHDQHKICICDNTLIFKVNDEVVFSMAMAILNESRIENTCCIQLLERTINCVRLRQVIAYAAYTCAHAGVSAACTS